MHAGLQQAPFLLAGRSGVARLKLFYCNIYLVQAAAAGRRGLYGFNP
jgi:hypothetical protein